MFTPSVDVDIITLLITLLIPTYTYTYTDASIIHLMYLLIMWSTTMVTATRCEVKWSEVPIKCRKPYGCSQVKDCRIPNSNMPTSNFVASKMIRWRPPDGIQFGIFLNSAFSRVESLLYYFIRRGCSQGFIQWLAGNVLCMDKIITRIPCLNIYQLVR